MRQRLNTYYKTFYLSLSTCNRHFKDLLIDTYIFGFYLYSLPFILGESIKQAFDLRIRNGKNVLTHADQNEMYRIIYKELFGIMCSAEFVNKQKTKIISDSVLKLSLTQNPLMMTKRAVTLMPSRSNHSLADVSYY